MKPICQTENRKGGAAEGGTASLVKEACAVAAAMSAEVARFRNCSEENLGRLETKVTALAQQLVREALAQGAQGKADATPPICPKCGQALSRVSAGHERTFTSRAGEISVQRTRG